MLYSKVRIEFSEESNPNVFNVVAQESGTNGANMLGIDLGVAIRAAPRPLLVLAEAIIDLLDSRSNESNREPPPLLKEARKYVRKWHEYDEAVKCNADPLSVPHPDAITTKPAE